MRTIINLFLAIALLISTFNLNAQSHKTLKDSSTVIIFNQTSTSTYKKKKPTGVSNIIKIAPLGFLSGTYLFCTSEGLLIFLLCKAHWALLVKT